MVFRGSGYFVPFALVIPWGLDGLPSEWCKLYFYRKLTGGWNSSHSPL